MADSSPQPGQPPVNSRPRGGVFVGRQQEMAELKAALDDAMSGQGHIVMIAGEPGIGKTRTARELTIHAERQGAQVFWGWCYEEGGAPPYWPWVQLVRAYVQQANADQLAAEMGTGAADISEIVAEVRGKLPHLKTPPTLEPEQARFRLFDSITTFLKNAAQSQPLMLVLDDLHWADRSSLQILEFLAKDIASSRLLLVGTYRDVEVSRRHPLSQTLGNLMRESSVGGFQRMQLGSLTQQEVGEFVEASIGVALSQDVRELLHGRTDGNPLFVGEVTRQIGPEDLTVGGAWANTIPEGIRDAIGRRLERLSEQCSEVLTTASIIGKDFDFRLLNILSGDMSEDQLLQMVDEAVSFHLIEEVPGQMDRYQFSHALIQQTLAEEVSTSRRVRLHARIAEGLEKLYGDDAEAHSAELAHHFAEAQTSTGPDKMVRYSLLAGEQALAAYAWDEALTHFESGLVARDITLSGTKAASDDEAAALLFGLSQAQVATLERHQRHEALGSLSRAFDYYAEAGDVSRAVAVAETPMFVMVGEATGMTQIVSRALELVPPGSYEAGRLLARHGSLLGLDEGDYAAAQDAFTSALTIAQSQGDVALEVRTLANATQVNLHHGRSQETIETGLRAIELASRIDDPRQEATARYYTSFALAQIGDLEGARRHSTALLALARRLRDRQLLAIAFSANQRLCLLQGEWDSARDYIDGGLALLPKEVRLLAGRATLEYQTGDFGQGRSYLDRLLESVRLNPPGPTTPYGMLASLIPTVARISGVIDRFEIAKEAADAVLSSPSVAPQNVLLARFALGLMSVQQFDVSAAGVQYSYLETRRGTMGPARMAMDRLLALLSQTMGNMDHAMAHFEEALAFCGDGGYRPEMAWTCSDYADALIQRNGQGDSSKAQSLLDESLAIATELGMRPLMERVSDRLGRVPAQPAATPTYPGGLTAREVEVLRLVASGKTNLEIAEELVIAEGTARRHVANIYEKIGAANRVEAATYAARQGLVPVDGQNSTA